MSSLKKVLLISIGFLFLVLGVVVVFDLSKVQEANLNESPLLKRFLQEGNQAYNAFDYAVALEKAEQGLSLARQTNDDKFVVRFLGSLGMVYEKQGQYQKALQDYFQPALAIAYKINYLHEITALLGNIGVVYHQLGQYQHALDHFQPSLELARNIGNKHKVVTSLNHIGGVYLNLEHYRQAEDYLWTALNLARKEQEVGLYHQGNSLGSLGAMYNRLEQRRRALYYLQQALEVGQRTENKYLKSQYLGLIGQVSGELEQPQQAEDNLQQALAIARTIGAKHLIAIHLNQLGQLYKKLGESEKAQTAFQESVLIQDTLGVSTAWKSQRELAVLNTGLKSHLTQPDTVISYYEHALDNLEKLRTGLTEKQQKLSFMQDKLFVYDEYLTLLQALHDKHPDKGYERTALETFEQKQGRLFLEEMGQSGAKRFAGIPDNILRRETELAEQLAQARQRIDAINIQTIDKDIKTQIVGQMLDNVWGSLFSMIEGPLKERLRNRTPLNSDELRQLQSYSEAFQGKTLFGITVRLDSSTFIQNLSVKTESSLVSGWVSESKPIAHMSHNWPTVISGINRYSLFSQHFSQENLSDDLIKTGIGQLVGDIAEMLGKAGKKTDDPDSSPTSPGETTPQHENTTLPHHNEPPKPLPELKSPPFNRLVETLPVSQLSDIVRLSLDLSQCLELEPRVSLLECFSEADQAIIIQQAEPVITSVYTAQEQMRRVELLAAQKALKEELQTRFPDYYALKYPEPTTFAEMQQVLHPDELMLVFSVMTDNTILWVIGQTRQTSQTTQTSKTSQKTLHMFNLPLGESALEEKVAQLRALIGTSDNTRGAKIRRRKKRERKDPFIQASHELYTQLIPEKVRPLLTTPRTVYVVPTGPLYALPFETLVTQSPSDTNQLGNAPVEKGCNGCVLEKGCKGCVHYLIEDVPIAYLSSASLLKTLREAQQHGQDTASYPFLAFANPIYEAKKTSEASKTSAVLGNAEVLFRGGDFAPLPETENEAKEIATLFNAPKHSEPLQLREAASRPTVFQLNDKNRLDDYQYILFATHGILPGEVDHLTQPALVLSYPDTEGYLTMADVFGLQLNAQLVALSACNTGSGKRQRGEGVMGLTRAFMYAGTPAIAVTLWSVEFFSAKTLSVGFFKQLKDIQKPAAALRAIKLRMLRGEEGKKYKRPYYWAPFVLFGNAV
jgi:CHAT domain-containing protein/tetratricopeptide (TPR) repeat protein